MSLWRLSIWWLELHVSVQPTHMCLLIVHKHTTYIIRCVFVYGMLCLVYPVTEIEIKLMDIYIL